VSYDFLSVPVVLFGDGARGTSRRTRAASVWLRKSEELLAKEHYRRLSFLEPALLWLTCVAATVAIFLEGPRFPTNGVWPTTWSKVVYKAALLGTIVAIADCILQVFFRKSIMSFVRPLHVVMCDNCHRVKHRDRQTMCECGGTFDDFDNWMWVDENQQETRRSGAAKSHGAHG
jgi:hypothetical protein